MHAGALTVAGASSMSSNALTLAANMAMVSGATTGAARAAAFAAALNAQHAAGRACHKHGCQGVSLVPPYYTSGSVSLMEARANAWCLLIHAEASLSLLADIAECVHTTHLPTLVF